MRKAGVSAIVLVVVALAVASGAVAKDLTNVILVGAGGRSTVVTPAKSLSMAFDSMEQPAPPMSAITAPFLLVYPLTEAGVPARPGRLYVRTQTFCGSWNTSAAPHPSDCWRFTDEQMRLLAAPHLVPLTSPLPRLLALRHGRTRLRFPGVTGSGSAKLGQLAPRDRAGLQSEG